VRESRMPGSARGARSNPRPYRDPREVSNFNWKPGQADIDQVAVTNRKTRQVSRPRRAWRLTAAMVAAVQRSTRSLYAISRQSPTVPTWDV